MSSLKDDRSLTGRQYWRSLDQLTGTPEFEEWLHREFPQGASEWANAWSRRSFLTLMGASLALAGLSGCRRPEEKIVPYVQPPEDLVPGIPVTYATTMPWGTSAYGILVESHEGRPTKIEGNPLHPSTRGAANAAIQASILDFYDPDRSAAFVREGVNTDWGAFVTFWREQFLAFQAGGGRGLAVLAEPSSSPTIARLRRAFQQRFPNARWIAWAPVADERRQEALRIAFGRDLQPVFHYDRAKVILSLDSDFLLTEDEMVAATHGFAAGRRTTSEKDRMNRLYAVEGLLSVTGANADHRLRLRAREVGSFALALAAELARQGLPLEMLGGAKIPQLSGAAAQWLAPLAGDLLRARGESLVVVGRRQPSAVHALAAALNEALGNTGRTITYVDNPDVARSDSPGLAELVKGMASGEIQALVMLGGNPAYNAPADLEFRAALAKVPTTVHLSTHRDETSQAALWHLPRAHYLEAWGDARAVDGTLSLVQPLIEPLYGGKSDSEVLALLAGGDDARGYDLVRETWRGLIAGDFENGWRQTLHDGILPGQTAAAVAATVRPGEIAAAIKAHQWEVASADARGLEGIFHPCYTTGDGRQANNGWLQELPDPITKLAWDNVATLSPKTAEELGVKNEDLVRVAVNGRELTLPVWIVPGQADYCVGLALGYGREAAGRVASGVGFDTYRLRTAAAMHAAPGVSLTPTGRSYELATTQDHGSMEGRPIVLEATLDEYRRDPDFAARAAVVPAFMAESPKAQERELVREYPSSWQEPSYKDGHQWGMAIDLSACTGCNACTVACQAENNIPVVGKDQVRRGREMHWIRVDRYFEGDLEDPRVVHQPMPCQHCENAPCEQVCPVAATVHSAEGLNQMVYNRCIGTRYCSNNCPYKVRRFNFYHYTANYPETIRMQQNPEVTVRSRGVMEKCTYCIQRISRGKRQARLENRTLRDGEVVSACQQACPAEAIVFGDINNPESNVVRVKKSNRDYALLGEYNTQPRTTYLARIRNLNPEMPA
ncbi:MAG TPA: TAT-variant-translocated molybdopterin oxidoreductase [candidate division Zixibacteria bacterium]|nr:TAT-variant-translocated molybdopterin oxidoreductase [candidate division Zixibacteria bacterium]MDD4917577.1 TAT-variant-translocated molybdopterin oxidoreductase [candidate division Zixibacteria bacterium]MDM7971500.1 TAT-variant-translocated molybdopterin oxidoreductase [candidate division Zixibacteria bacterium]HOD67117.1 TAT-variant-translocated molybdopterin oxidoreductase [candidate division Zixibacteria bacterium]HPM38584.1 TAT-variant-translocated molybdopterin oxidoreductase [candi